MPIKARIGEARPSAATASPSVSPTLTVTSDVPTATTCADPTSVVHPAVPAYPGAYASPESWNADHPDRIRRLHQNAEQCVIAPVIMVSCYRLYNAGIFSETFGVIGADGGMRSLDLVIDGLTDVMQ